MQMKHSTIAIGALIGIFAFAIAGTAAKGADVSDVYSGLRNMALGIKPGMVGQPASAPANLPYGVVTDIGLDNGTATIVTFSDGNASIYLSTGGGFLGGEGHSNISSAAKAAVSAAASAVSVMRPTAQYPLPQPGHVNFYVLTPAGIMTAISPEPALNDATQPLGRLYDAVQNVITQYRSIQQ
jgi:hypothetical protein